jgi:probable HAF family extracellular repeat protein
MNRPRFFPISPAALWLIAASSALAQNSAPSPSAAVTYSLVNLGTLGGPDSYATAINVSGQIVGVSDTTTGPRHAFLYTSGRLHDLGTTGGNSSEACAINDLGQIVGQSDLADGSSHAFLWQDGRMQSLGGNTECATAINASGQIVGYTVYSEDLHIMLATGGKSGVHPADSSASGPPRSFFWSAGHFQDLGPLGNIASEPYGINDSGQIVGEFDHDEDLDTHAYLFHAGQLRDLTADTKHGGTAHAINNHGQIVGSIYGPGGYGLGGRAFLFDQGRLQDLGSLGGDNSDALALSPSGQFIVGSSRVPWHEGHAFIVIAGTMQDLNVLVGDDALAAAGLRTLQVATGVNDRGQIVGRALSLQGRETAFLLMPGPPMLLPPTPPPPPPVYTLTFLGSLGGPNSTTHAINQSGQIVGEADTAAGLGHAFLYSAGQMHDLEPFAKYHSCANGLNDAGDIVGEATPSDGRWQQAFLIHNGQRQWLGALGGYGGTATAINNHGQIVGAAHNAEGNWHAFLYTNGRMRELPGQTSYGGCAQSINDAGQIVGEIANKFGWQQACLYQNGQLQFLNPPDRSESSATAINASGQIIGDNFLYSDGKMQDLTSLLGFSARITAINNQGQIVGFCSRTPGLPSHPFLYRDGTLHDLVPLIGVAQIKAAGLKVITDLSGINDSGLIIGNGLDAQGHSRAFLLTPIAGNASASTFSPNLHFASGPPGGADLVRQELPHWSSPGADRQTDFETQDLSTLTIQPPIPTYSLDTDKLDQGVGPANTHLNGYSYLITSGHTQLADAYVDLDKSGAPELVSLHYRGDDLGALHQLAGFDQFRHGTFEPRFLGAAPYLEILWLKSAPGGPDFFYMLSSNPPFFETNQLYPTTEFLKNLAAYLQNEIDLHRNDLPGSSD